MAFPPGWEEIEHKSDAFRWSTFFGKSKDNPADALWFGGIVAARGPIVTPDILEQQYAADLKRSEYSDVRWFVIDGFKGILTREAAGNKAPADLQKIEWHCYRVYKGQPQLLNFFAYTSKQAFNRNAGELERILGAMKFIR